MLLRLNRRHGVKIGAYGLHWYVTRYTMEVHVWRIVRRCLREAPNPVRSARLVMCVDRGRQRR